jgi:hypothetical protein
MNTDNLLTALRTMSIQIAAIHDVTVCLVAMQARSADDSESVYREISDGLDARLARAEGKGLKLASVEDLRINIDAIIAQARVALGNSGTH